MLVGGETALCIHKVHLGFWRGARLTEVVEPGQAECPQVAECERRVVGTADDEHGRVDEADWALGIVADPARFFEPVHVAIRLRRVEQGRGSRAAAHAYR